MAAQCRQRPERGVAPASARAGERQGVPMFEDRRPGETGRRRSVGGIPYPAAYPSAPAGRCRASGAAQRQAAAWRPYRRAMALFCPGQRELIAHVLLLNWTIARWTDRLCESGAPADPKLETGKLVAVLDWPNIFRRDRSGPSARRQHLTTTRRTLRNDGWRDTHSRHKCALPEPQRAAQPFPLVDGRRLICHGRRRPSLTGRTASAWRR
jgi:hypothetical protein